MGKKSIEDRFSIELDAYINGIEGISESKSEEYNELLELGKTLVDKDFSENSNKEAVFNKVFKYDNKYKGGDYMKKSNKSRRFATIAASLALTCMVGISLLQTSFAQEIVVKVIRTISLGHITAVQTTPSKTKAIPISDELKGKIFDEEGKPVETISDENMGKLYTADGEKIYQIKNGKIITEPEKEKIDNENKLEVKDSSKLNNYVCFNVILPSYLPEGYEFDRAVFYKDEKGAVSDKYISLQFVNKETGKDIFIQQRFADEETAYQMGTDGEIEEVKINGIDALILDGRNMHWEDNDVLYILLGRGEISKDELIKIAESIK